MQNISPRKYFETRLRQLPIISCFVNEDWKEEKMANVMVLRRMLMAMFQALFFWLTCFALE